MPRQQRGTERPSCAFDVRANPFVVLDVSRAASAADIEAAYLSSLGKGITSEPDLFAARQILLDRRARLEAELSTLFDADGSLARGTLEMLRAGETAAVITDGAAALPALARTNLLAHLYASAPADSNGLKSLLEAQSSVSLDTVLTAVNDARAAAQFDPVDAPEVAEAARALRQRQIEAMVAGMTDISAAASAVASCVHELSTGGASGASDCVGLLRQAYGRTAAAELSRRREALSAACDQLKDAPNNAAGTEAVITSLTHWAELWQALQRAELETDPDAARAHEVRGELHALYAWLAGRNELEAARRIDQAIIELFGALPEEEDSPVSRSGLGQASAAPTFVSALTEYLDNFSNRSRPLLDQWRKDERRDSNIAGAAPQAADIRPVPGPVSKEHDKGLAAVASTAVSDLVDRLNRVSPTSNPAHDGSGEAGTGLYRISSLRDRLAWRPPATLVRVSKHLGWGAAGLAAAGLVAVFAVRHSDRASAARTTEASPASVVSAAADPPAAPPPAAGPVKQTAEEAASASAPSTASVADASPVTGGFENGAPAGGPETAPPIAPDAEEAANSSLNLLLTPDATKVQQRLAELGYFGHTPNGIWGPQSRRALREFKSANALPQDDGWDAGTQARLFSDQAQPGKPASAGTGLPDDPKGPETRYPPPTGTTLNPLNRADAVRVQKRLAELRYFTAAADGVWGETSRKALRDLKIVNGLPADDEWNADTERLLGSPQVLKASDSFIGGWASDPADCQRTDRGAAPVFISTREAKTSGGSCNFGTAQRTQAGWNVPAICTGNNEKWKANVKLTVSGDTLTWVSERGTMTFHRCAAAVTSN